MSNKSFEIVVESRWLRKLIVFMKKLRAADLSQQMPAGTRSRIFHLSVF
jgi:hypothetical protein